MNKKTFYDFLLHQERKEYDLPQAVRSALDALDNVPLLGRTTLNVEDLAQFFYSELVVAALEASGAIPCLNASEVTPIDLCMFRIYSGEYSQLKGEKTLIKGYNTLSPDGWGEGE